MFSFKTKAPYVPVPLQRFQLIGAAIVRTPNNASKDFDQNVIIPQPFIRRDSRWLLQALLSDYTQIDAFIRRFVKFYS